MNSKAVARKTAFILARRVEPNRGDMASRYGVLRALRHAVPDAIVAAVSVRPASELPDGCRTLPLTKFRNLFPGAEERALYAEYKSVVLWTCGHDYSDDGSPFKTIHATVRALISRVHGVPFWVIAQGAGPIRHGITKFSIRLLGAFATRLFIRDPESLALMQSMMRKKDHPKLALSADSALLAVPQKSAAEAAELPAVATLGINVREWFHLNHGLLPMAIASKISTARPEEQLDPRMEILLDHLARLADHAIEDYAVSVKFLPMYPPNTENWELDEYLSQRVIQRMSHADCTSILDKDVGLDELVAIFRSLSAMIGVRLHSTIIATACNVPAVHIAYSPKGWSYFKMLGQDEFVLGVEDVASPEGYERLRKAFDKLWENQSQCRAAIHKNGAVLRELAMKPIEALAQEAHRG